MTIPVIPNRNGLLINKLYLKIYLLPDEELVDDLPPELLPPPELLDDPTEEDPPPPLIPDEELRPTDDPDDPDPDPDEKLLLLAGDE